MKRVAAAVLLASVHSPDLRSAVGPMAGRDLDAAKRLLSKNPDGSLAKDPSLDPMSTLRSEMGRAVNSAQVYLENSLGLALADVGESLLAAYGTVMRVAGMDLADPYRPESPARSDAGVAPDPEAETSNVVSMRPGRRTIH